MTRNFPNRESNFSPVGKENPLSHTYSPRHSCQCHIQNRHHSLSNCDTGSAGERYRLGLIAASLRSGLETSILDVFVAALVCSVLHALTGFSEMHATGVAQAEEIPLLPCVSSHPGRRDVRG
jgi:hypothetical protein